MLFLGFLFFKNVRYFLPEVEVDNDWTIHFSLPSFLTDMKIDGELSRLDHSCSDISFLRLLTDSKSECKLLSSTPPLTVDELAVVRVPIEP